MEQSPWTSESHAQHKWGGGGSGKVGAAGPNRRIRISKAMSRLLRHSAHSEGVSIDERGYVNVADMLKWHKMRKELNVRFEEVLEEVRDNEKQRFALLHVPPESISSKQQKAGTNDKAVPAETEKLDLPPQTREENDQGQTNLEEAAVSSSPSATALALKLAFSTPNPDPSHYLIRAAQGHSIKLGSASSYLTPITLANPTSIPETVVHGTFYPAWESILRTGGLKPMSRVHVHFATGPSLESVLDAGTEGKGKGKKEDVKGVLGEGKAVISGMRSDAQILIYINIRKALEMGLTFWLSENGVVLSEGVVGTDKKGPKVVPIECWDVAVEVREGLGILWAEGELIKQLPEHLKRMGWPHRKERKGNAGAAAIRQKNQLDGGARGGKRTTGKGGAREKPRLTVERSDDHHDDLG